MLEVEVDWRMKLNLVKEIVSEKTEIIELETQKAHQTVHFVAAAAGENCHDHRHFVIPHDCSPSTASGVLSSAMLMKMVDHYTHSNQNLLSSIWHLRILVSPGLIWRWKINLNLIFFQMTVKK